MADMEQAVIVGHKHHKGAQRIQMMLREGAALAVIREPGNRYDANAIMVRVPVMSLREVEREVAAAEGAALDRATLTFMLGYIPKADAARIAPKLDRQQPSSVTLRGEKGCIIWSDAT